MVVMAPKVPRMNPTQARAWMALISTVKLLPPALDHQLTSDAGLIAFEYGILGLLNVAPEQTLPIGELGAALKSPAPRLSKAVTRLEGRGLVERLSCATDGRAVHVQLTRDGRRAWLVATPPHMALARDTVLGDFSEEELTEFAILLEKVVHRLDPKELT